MVYCHRRFTSALQTTLKGDRPMYLSDYHFHTLCSADSPAPLLQQAEAAIAAGVREICVTDHWNLLDQQGTRLPTVYGWEPSLAQWRELRNCWPGQLELRLGVEVGNGILDPAAVDASLTIPELDFVIGSLHSQSAAAGGRGIYTVAKECTEKEDGTAILDDYMDMLEELVQIGGWDVLGHIIYPLRYLPPEYGLDLHPWWDRLAGVFRTVIAQGKGIELNTSAGATVEQWRDVLELYRDLGGEVLTLGSDAHRPQHMAAAFPQALELIRETGFRWLCVYRRRTPLFCKLDS